MFTKRKCIGKQGGVALVISLLLLLVLTVIAVASMSGSLMQERMSGNVNLQTLAFEAASAGVPDSLEYGLDDDNWDGNTSCSRGGAGWLAPWSDLTTVPVPNLPNDIVVEYRRRIGCFEPDEIPPEWEDPDFSVPTQLLVLNQGRVRRSTSGELLATREVEVRIENRGGDSQCAIRIEGGLGDIDISGGGPEVDGGEHGGCSISVSPEYGGVGDLIDAVGQTHIGKYTPPPQDSDGHPPWNNSVTFADVVNQLKVAVLAYQDYVAQGQTQADWRCNIGDRLGFDDLTGCDPDPTVPGVTGDEEALLERILGFIEDRSDGWDVNQCKSTFYDGSVRIGSGNIGGGHCDVDWGASSNGNNNQRFHHTNVPVGDPSDPAHITYIAGHLGNPSNSSGSGIVIMEGGNCWSGTADFQGLQLILGGHFEIIGGGGGDTTGSIILSNLNDRYGDTSSLPDFWGWRGSSKLWEPVYVDPGSTEVPPVADPEHAYFDPSGLKYAGGGNHSVTFSCGDPDDPDEVGYWQYIDRINQCLETDFEPNCGPEGFGMRKAIASWREYVDRQRWP